MEPIDTYEQEAPQKRPVFLLVLCILTLVSTGFGVFGPLFQLIMGQKSDAAMQMESGVLLKSADEMRNMGMSSLAGFYEKLAEMNAQINENVYAYAAVALIIVLAGLFGAIFMLKGRKLGFHLYIGYSIAQLAFIYLFVSVENVPSLIPISGGVISALFIFMYSRNLHWLK